MGDDGTIFLKTIVDDKNNRLVAEYHQEGFEYCFSQHNGIVNGYDIYKCKVVVSEEGYKKWEIKTEKIFKIPKNNFSNSLDGV